MNLARYYAQALYGLEKSRGFEFDQGKADSFISLLKRKGHMKLLRSIVSEYEKIKEEYEVAEKATLTVGKESDKEHAKQRIQTYLTDQAAVFEEKVDDRLIGGYVFTKGDVRVDASFKRQLVNLYKKLVV